MRSNKNINIIKKGLFFLCIIGCAIIMFLITEPKISRANFQITPSLLELEMKKGESRTFPIRIHKEQNTNFTYKIGYIANPVINPKDKENTKLEIIYDNKENSPNSWIKLEENSDYYNCTVTLPNDIAAGAYFPIIIFKQSEKTQEITEETTESPINNNALNLNIELSTLLYINVLGEEANHKVEINNSLIDQINIFSFPNSIEISIQNTGNSFFYPRGAITIINPNNTYKNYNGAINSNYDILLPNQVLSNKIEIQNSNTSILKSGVYQYNVQIFTDQSLKNPTIYNSSFIYLAPIEIVVILSLIIITVLLVNIIIRALKGSRNSKI